MIRILLMIVLLLVVVKSQIQGSGYLRSMDSVQQTYPSSPASLYPGVLVKTKRIKNDAVIVNFHYVFNGKFVANTIEQAQFDKRNIAYTQTGNRSRSGISPFIAIKKISS
jgi:hypothetical protein